MQDLFKAAKEFLQVTEGPLYRLEDGRTPFDDVEEFLWRRKNPCRLGDSSGAQTRRIICRLIVVD